MKSLDKVFIDLNLERTRIEKEIRMFYRIEAKKYYIKRNDGIKIIDFKNMDDQALTLFEFLTKSLEKINKKIDNFLKKYNFSNNYQKALLFSKPV